MDNLREKAHQIIDSLSDQRLETIYEYLQFIKLKEELKATYELTNDEMIKEISDQNYVTSSRGQ